MDAVLFKLAPDAQHAAKTWIRYISKFNAKSHKPYFFSKKLMQPINWTVSFVLLTVFNGYGESILIRCQSPAITVYV